MELERIQIADAGTLSRMAYGMWRIADDGEGVGDGREGSYGLEIMRERAARIGAELIIRDREGGGTVVEVVL